MLQRSDLLDITRVAPMAPFYTNSLSEINAVYAVVSTDILFMQLVIDVLDPLLT